MVTYPAFSHEGKLLVADNEGRLMQFDPETILSGARCQYIVQPTGDSRDKDISTPK